MLESWEFSYEKHSNIISYFEIQIIQEFWIYFVELSTSEGEDEEEGEEEWKWKEKL